MGAMRNSLQSLVGEPGGRVLMEDILLDGRTVLTF
jgi:hypothetical protein